MINKRKPGSGSPHGTMHLPWHSAFLQAVQHELFDYRDFLEFQPELQLTAEPLRIDLLVVKKLKKITIDKNIARIFRTNNIIEYKSPDDYLSVRDFWKVYAYTNLYAAITDGVDLSDITVTFIESKYPRRLLKYLTVERGYNLNETSPGIYYISGDYIPMQIIESKKLNDSENLWLKSLTNGLEIRNAGDIFEEMKRRQGKMPVDAYLDVLLRANPEIFLEVQKMAVKTKNRRTFEEVFTEAGIIPEWIERGRTQGIEQGKADVARNLLARGMPIEDIVMVTELPFEEVSAIAAG